MLGAGVLLGGVRLLSLARSLLRQCPGAFRTGVALAAACGAGAEFRGIAGRTEGNVGSWEWSSMDEEGQICCGAKDRYAGSSVRKLGTVAGKLFV